DEVFLTKSIMYYISAQVTKVNELKYRLIRGTQLADHRTETRQVLRAGRRLDAQNRILGVGIAGQGQIGADGMIVIAMADRADEGIVVGHFGEARQMLADGKARHRRGDGSKFAPDFLRSARFQVPGVEVRRAAIIE